MCGVSGILSFNHAKSPSIEELTRMSNALIHRGPDGSGHFIDRGLGFGFRRLKIIDPVSGNQPMSNQDGSVTIVFNGEIYNFKEIRNALKNKYEFKTNSDTEVLIRLYQEKSFEMVHELNGMFAFTIWDKKNELLFCARDQAGQKPFFYAFENGRFIFASEIKSILTASPALKEIDLKAVSKYLAFEYVPSPHTIFTRIRKLPAGHFLVVRVSGESELKRYWKIESSFSEKKINLSETEISGELRRSFKSAVKRHLMSDVPVGAFLSGGIDSSSVVAMMSELNGSNPVNTFSIGFEEDGFDESDFANEVAHCFNTNHLRRRFTASDAMSLLPEIIRGMDEPFADSSLLPMFWLSRTAKQSTGVVLGGDGGDELFAGYPTFQGHQLRRYFNHPWIKKTAALISQAWPASFSNNGPDFLLKRFLQGLDERPEMANQMWLGSFSHQDQLELLNREVSVPISQGHVYEDILNFSKEIKKPIDLINQIASQYFRFYLQDDILAKVDRAGMAYALEVRSPFLDKEFMEFSASLAPHLKLRGLASKYIFKKAMSKALPKKILNRQKRGFSLPLGMWLRGPFKKQLIEVLNPSHLKRHGFFKTDYVERLLQEHLGGKRDNRKQLWTLFIFQLWYDRLSA